MPNNKMFFNSSPKLSSNNPAKRISSNLFDQDGEGYDLTKYQNDSTTGTPIYINGNDDFIIQASENNWNGN
ncbi:MAG: hypothetical protein ACFFD1_04980, partial [Candidatus Thorarchaeota archaeon]